VRFSFGNCFAVLVAFAISFNVSAQTPRLVAPGATDPNITQFTNYHLVYVNASIAARGQLFVFLPGTGGAPAGYTSILKTAANLGFHSVGLMYDNAITMHSICGDSPDPDGYKKARLAVIAGGTNEFISVSAADSITNRLAKLIQYLTTAAPAQNWNQFLRADGSPNWSKILFAGHSQGAGDSDLIAKIYPVARVLMFDDADWWTPNGVQPGELAHWIPEPGVTPPEFYFGMVHVNDGLVPYDQQLAAWAGFGMNGFGSAVIVENSAAPYDGSHMLTTALPPRSGTSSLDYHNASVVDSATPLQPNGVPVFQSVWQFMMTGPPKLPQLAILLTGATAQLSFGTYAHIVYQVQSSTDLVTWADVGPPIGGDGNTVTSNIDLPIRYEFYRVEVAF
jgi:hypothetical protein